MAVQAQVCVAWLVKYITPSKLNLGNLVEIQVESLVLFALVHLVVKGEII